MCIRDSHLSVPYQAREFQYASFWVRAIAFSMDLCILGITTVALSIVLGLMQRENYDAGLSEASGAMFALLVLFVHPFMTWLYFAVMQCSRRQATLGKQALGIKVTTLQGNRISFGKATVRFMCKLLSTLFVFIGYLIALVSKQNQSLHDKMAETLVIKSR